MICAFIPRGMNIHKDSKTEKKAMQTYWQRLELYNHKPVRGWIYQKLEKAKKGSSLNLAKDAWLCQYLD
jgi:predicted DNA-binding protein YlxM (UPF0122 family)